MKKPPNEVLVGMTDAARSWVLNPPREAVALPRQSADTAPRFVLRADPPLFDIPAWQAWLDELRNQPPGRWGDDMIASVEGHIAAVSKAR